MSTRSNFASKTWAIVMIVLIFVINSFVLFVAAVTMDTEEETSVVRATTNEVPKADDKVVMPEISLEEIQVSYSPAPSVEEEIIEETKPTEYIVESGDSLWGIADEVYGDGTYYPYLMKNNDMDSELIYKGQALKLVYFDDSEAETIKDECYEYINGSSSSNTDTVTYSNNKLAGSVSAINGNAPSGNMTFLGNYKITGYDPWCTHCCGKANGITASGTMAEVGRTVGAKGIPYGTKIYIEGYGTYVVEDTGGFNTNVIDIAAASHDDCYKLTNYSVPVYIID